MTEAIPGNAGRDDYPRMLFHPDGRTTVVDTPEQEDPMLREGWSQKPAEVHLKPDPTPSVGFAVADPLAVMIRNVLEQVLDERGVGHSPGHEPVPELPPLRSRQK
jgi:hypothetical protein